MNTPARRPKKPFLEPLREAPLAFVILAVSMSCSFFVWKHLLLAGLDPIYAFFFLSVGIAGSLLIFGNLYSLSISRLNALKLAESAAIIDSTEDAVIGMTLDGSVKSWNPAAARIYGWSADEMIGRPLSVLLGDGRESEMQDLLSHIRTSGRVSYYQTIRKRKDGKEIQVTLTLSAIRGQDRKLVGASSIDRDITPLKEVGALLEKSRDFYLTLLEEFPALIWRSSVDGRRDYFNKTWLAFTGCTAEQEKGGGWESRLHYADAERYLHIYREAHASQTPFEVEYRMRRTDGATRWIIDYGIPFRGLDGGFGGFIGTCHDITDRKKTETDLRQSLDLLFSIVENIPDMIFLKDANELRFELFNRAGEELLGYKREELIGKNDYDFFPKEQADFFTRNDYEVLTGKKMKTIAEEVIQTRAHGPRVLHTKKVPILSDEKGNPLYLLGISEDITDRKKAVEALRESEERLRSIMDNTTAVIYLKDLEGRYLHVNRRFEALFQIRNDQVVGKTDFDVFPRETAAQFRENDAMVIQSGMPREVEEAAADKDGRRRTYISVKFPILGADGEPRALCGISTDITERKMAEEQIRKANHDLVRNERILLKALADVEKAHLELKKAQSQLIRAEKFAAIGKLAGIVSHEFRNQLGVIRNSAYFIRMKLDTQDDKVKKHLDIIEKEVEETDRIIENILSYAKKNKPETRPEDLRELLETSLSKIPVPEGIAVQRTIPDNLPPILADRILLMRVFMNIVLNALQAMKPPGELRIRAVPSERSVRVVFEDTGSGIDEANRKNIFDPLFSTKSHGTGLGLATAKVLVEAHGGTIAVESRPGEGTQVIVELPAAAAAEAHP